MDNYLKCKQIKYTDQKAQTGWADKKSTPVYMLFTRDPPQTQGHLQTESKGIGTFHTNGIHKKAGVAILVSDKIHFKAMTT